MEPGDPSITWCIETFGINVTDPQWYVSGRYTKSYATTFYFKTKEDAMLFKLRWS